MRRILAISLLSASSALAQQPSTAMVQGVIAEVEAQRSQAQTRAAQLAGALNEAQEAAKAKDAEIEELKKKCGEPCKPKDEKK